MTALMDGNERRQLINNENRAQPLDLDQLHRFFDRFNVSPTHYALQQSDGSYVARNVAPSPILYARHLAGACTIAAYANDHQAATSKWACLDLDDADGFERLKSVQASLLATHNVDSLLETSRRGAHLWIFIGSDWHSLTSAWKLARAVATVYALKGDLFPKLNGLGGCVRVPLGIHRKTGQRYPLWSPTTADAIATDLATQLSFIASVRPVRYEQMTNLIALAEAIDPQLLRAAVRVHNTQPSRKVQIIRDYVRLEHLGLEPDPRGMMSCPLHPPDRQPSFHWNEAARLWCCFHENIGGDVIDLFRRTRNSPHGIPRDQAVDELYRFVLNDQALQRPPPPPKAS